MIKIIILDLDGPILDGKCRHYQCYKGILLEKGYTPMPVEKYWDMKRNKLDRHQQLAVTGADAIYNEFLIAWLERIESPKMLALDKIQPKTIEKLLEWRSMGIFIVLATMRKHSDRLDKQLKSLGLYHLMDKIIVCDYNEGGTGKALKVKENLPYLNPKQCLWIGDTEADVEAAKLLGCPIWLVSQGLRTEAYLASLKPDFLGAYIADIDIEFIGLHSGSDYPACVVRME